MNKFLLFHICRSKTVNKEQITILFDEMIDNPDIARGLVRENKAKVSDFWEIFKDKLNSVGPPVKTTAEWKKVWLDQRIYLRKKATTNMQYRKGTGGGPNKEYKFSPAEESILEILGTKEAADGVEGSRIFGFKITKSADETQNSLTREEKQTNFVTNEVTVEPTIKQTNLVTEPAIKQTNLVTEPTIKQANCKKRKAEMTTAEIAMSGLEYQKKLCDEMANFKSTAEKHYCDEESSFRRIYRAPDKIHEQQILSNDEMKKHHRKMEEKTKFFKFPIKKTQFFLNILIISVTVYHFCLQLRI